MNPQTINLALQGVLLATQLLAEIHKQSGMTDQQLLDLASEQGQQTRDAAERFIASIS